MSPLTLILNDVLNGAPRVSGDEPVGDIVEYQGARCSPRERG